MKFRHNNLFCLQIQEYTTMHALVMEYIEGPAIDDKEKILSDGYDMGEIDVMEVISSSIICTTDMKAEIWECRGGTFGYLFAFTIVLYLLIKHIFHFNLLVTYKGSIGDSRHDALNRKLRVKIKYNNCLVTCK